MGKQHAYRTSALVAVLLSVSLHSTAAVQYWGQSAVAKLRSASAALTEAAVQIVEGSSPALSEEGYQHVAELKSDTDMMAFMRRVLQAEGLEVNAMSEENLKSLVSLVASFSGSGGQSAQSFDTLKHVLLNQDWVKSQRKEQKAREATVLGMMQAEASRVGFNLTESSAIDDAKQLRLMARRQDVAEHDADSKAQGGDAQVSAAVMELFNRKRKLASEANQQVSDRTNRTKAVGNATITIETLSAGGTSKTGEYTGGRYKAEKTESNASGSHWDSALQETDKSKGNASAAASSQKMGKSESNASGGHSDIVHQEAEKTESDASAAASFEANARKVEEEKVGKLKEELGRKRVAERKEADRNEKTLKAHMAQLKAHKMKKEETIRKAKDDAKRLKAEKLEAARHKAERHRSDIKMELARKEREEAHHEASDKAERERQMTEIATREADALIEETKRKIKDSADSKAKEIAGKAAKEEELHKAKDEVARLEMEEAARKAREHAEFKAKEDAERKAKAEVARLAMNEARVAMDKALEGGGSEAVQMAKAGAARAAMDDVLSKRVIGNKKTRK